MCIFAIKIFKMKKKAIFYFILIFIFLDVNAQNDNLETLNIGVGFVNTLTHGDLTSVNNIDKNFFNSGFYIYVDKMFTPALGIELKFQRLKLNGFSQELSSSYPIDFTNYNSGDLYFEGNSLGGEVNLIINLNGLSQNPYAKKIRKLNFNSYFGFGYHSYNSELYSYSELDGVGFSYTPESGINKNAMYYTFGLGARYFISKRIDLELRQSFNFNTKDDLDAAITEKQIVESFFTTQLGVIIKLDSKGHDNIIWLQKKVYNTEVDTDLDGVVDRFDVDNNTPKGARVYANGVAVDSDKDGIIDFYDKCPLIFGVKEDKGCPLNKNRDLDGDSVPDYKDLEKDTPKGAKVSKNGIAIDSDKDGIIDFYDKCKFIKGSKENEGCPGDSDHDGVYDTNDKCPKVPGTIENNGCPELINALSKTDHEELLRLAKSIFFSSGESELRESSKRELEKVYEIMVNNSYLDFVIEGHTDSGGNQKYNLKLSQDRANAVRMYLIFLGVHPNRLKAIGYGFSKPKYTNTSEDGRQLNRRVEIKVDEDLMRSFKNLKTHLVNKSDTIETIAKLYNVTVEQLMKWNNLNSHQVYIGNRLLVRK